MELTFNNLVDMIRNLSLDEKEELLDLTENAIIEERRNEIRKNYQKCMEEYKAGGLKFSNNMEELKKRVSE